MFSNNNNNNNQPSYRKNTYVNTKDVIHFTKATNQNHQSYYVIGKKLATGGQGVVHFAEPVIGEPSIGYTYKQNSQHRRVIKIEVNAGTINEKDLKTRLNILNKTKHLHAQFTQNTERTRFFTVMYYFEKETLDTVIHKLENAPNALKFELAKKISTAVKKLIHDLGVIHIDLKPQNICVDIDWKNYHVNSVKIIDYDLGNIVDNIEDENSIIKLEAARGTIEYFAPEVYQSIVSRKSDIFSLSIIFGLIFQCWEGKLLRKKMSQRDFKPEFIFNSPVSAIPIMDDLLTLLNSMSEMDPLKRPNINVIIDKIILLEQMNTAYEIKNKLGNDFNEPIINIITVIRETATELGDRIKTFFNTADKKFITYTNFRQEVLPEFTKICKEIETINKKIESPHAKLLSENDYIREFTKAFDVNALRHCKTAQECIITFSSIINIFIEHFLFLHSNCQNAELNLKNKQTTIEKLFKKINKLKTIDEIHEFNTFYNKEFNQLRLDILPRKSIALKLENRLDKLNDLTSLKNFFENEITNNQKVLKAEQSAVRSFLFGKEGITDTWGEVIEKLQSKTLKLIQAEYERGNLEDKHFEELSPIFAERTSRFWDSPYKRKFEDLRQEFKKNFNIHSKKGIR